ncbi:MAG: GtrA family protein [Rhodospirillaceae bacterium]
MRKIFHSQFARFLVTGGAAAGVNIVSRYLLTGSLGYRWAVVVAYICGMTAAWVLARSFAFTPSGRGRAAEYARFALVNAVAAIQVYVVSVGLAEYAFPAAGFTWRPEDVAHVIGVTIPVFTSYLGHKHFSFAPKSP